MRFAAPSSSRALAAHCGFSYSEGYLVNGRSFPETSFLLHVVSVAALMPVTAAVTAGAPVL